MRSCVKTPQWLPTVIRIKSKLFKVWLIWPLPSHARVELLLSCLFTHQLYWFSSCSSTMPISFHFGASSLDFPLLRAFSSPALCMNGYFLPSALQLKYSKGLSWFFFFTSSTLSPIYSPIRLFILNTIWNYIIYTFICLLSVTLYQN